MTGMMTEILFVNLCISMAFPAGCIYLFSIEFVYIIFHSIKGLFSDLCILLWNY